MNMRRLVFIVVGAALLLSVPFSVMGQSASDITALSRYYPANSPFFVGLRADDAYLDTLDTLIQRVTAITGEDMPLPSGIRETFSQVIGELVPGGNFDNTIRSWMGDTIALGATDLELATDANEENNSDAFVIAIAVDDADALRAFIEEVLIPNSEDVSNVETLQIEGVTVYEVLNNEGDFTYYAVAEQVAFVSGNLNAIENIVIDGSGLNTVDDFNAVINQLPADQYNIAAYVDVPVFAQASLEAAQNSDMSMGGNIGMAENLLNASGVLAVGATMLDDNTLAIDAAQLAGETDTAPTASIDSTFAHYIPAGTPLVIHGHNLSGGIDAALNALREVSAAADSPDFNSESIDDALSFANFFTRGTLGLDLQEDILSWMTGDFAVALALADDFPVSMEAMNSTNHMPIEFGVLFEATNPDQATALVAGLRRAAEMAAEDNTNISVESAVEGGSEALRVTLDTPDAPFDVVLLAGATNDVFVLGTEGMVAAALNPDGGLDSDPLYQEASSYALPNASQLWYFAGEPLMPLVDLARSTSDGDGDGLQDVLSLFHSSSISSTVNENGTSITRAAFTLPQ